MAGFLVSELRWMIAAGNQDTSAASPQSSVIPWVDVYSNDYPFFVLIITVRKMVMMCNFGFTDEEYEEIYM